MYSVLRYLLLCEDNVMEPTMKEKLEDHERRLEAIEILKTPINDGDGFVNAIEFLNGNPSFNRNRWIAMMVLNVLLAGMTYWQFEVNSVFFPFVFGFFISAMILLFVLFIDQWLIDVDTFKKIKESPIALSIVVLSIALMFGIGVTAGQKLLPDAIRGEASTTIHIEQNEQQSNDSETSGDNAEQDRNEGVPNR
jgi:hypothetical protein